MILEGGMGCYMFANVEYDIYVRVTYRHTYLVGRVGPDPGAPVVFHLPLYYTRGPPNIRVYPMIRPQAVREGG